MKLKIIVPLLALTFVLFAAETNTLKSAAPATGAQIKRGQYLVERVCVCGECHSPKNDKGEYDRSQWLQGDLIDYKPTGYQRLINCVQLIADGLRITHVFVYEGLAQLINRYEVGFGELD